VSDTNVMTATVGGSVGLCVGCVLGLILGFLGPNFAAWEMGKNAGELTAWGKVPHGVRICKMMLDRRPLNDIQEEYCAELLAKALGEID
jgi:hypothetical protein